MEENTANSSMNQPISKSTPSQPISKSTPSQPSSKASEVSASSTPRTINPSSVWNHFTKITPTHGKKVVSCKCNYCHKELKCPSQHGTSSLQRHLLRCWNYPYNTNDKKQKLLKFTTDESDGKTITSAAVWKFDQELCRKELARMIIMDELPFKFVEREGFKKFVRTLQPRFNLLSRTTMAKDCFALYEEEKKKLKDVFRKNGQRVCLTTDMWTSIQNLGYMCLTAHYIDQDWKLHKKIINFCVVPSPHTGEVISNVIELCLFGWGLEKFSTITVDNASSNDVALRNLKRRLIKKNGLLLDGEFFHVRCSAHILNLIVKQGLEHFGDSVIKIRSVVKYVRSSPARSQMFKLCCEQEKIECKRTLCLDVSTRWNSTFLMLQTALEFQKAFECLEDRDSSLRTDCKDMVPNEQDWQKARLLTSFLEVFYDATLTLSGSQYVTSNAYFAEVYGIESMLMEWSRSADPMCRAMALAMMDKFKKYWDSTDKINIFLVIAVVLDPRFKLEYVQFSYAEICPDSEVEIKMRSIRDVMDRLLRYYQSHESSAMVDLSSTSSLTSSDSSSINPAKARKRKFFQRLEERENTVTGTGTELDRYLMEGLVKDDGDDFDILNWWKVNSSRFFILSKMARDILPIPVSTVASESAFSTGGRILDQFRSSLTPQIVESLVCAQDWLRHAQTPIDMEENLDELENVFSDESDDSRATQTQCLTSLTSV